MPAPDLPPLSLPSPAPAPLGLPPPACASPAGAEQGSGAGQAAPPGLGPAAPGHDGTAQHDPDFYHHLRAEFSDGWRWVDRAVVLAYGALAGLVVVLFTFLCYVFFGFFEGLQAAAPGWLMLLLTPAVTAGIVWLTRRWFAMAAGSGIPQVIAALEPSLDDAGRGHFVSLKLSAAKLLLGAAGLLGGLSVGREGPSVQVAAGVMLHSMRWLRGRPNGLNPGTLLVAGGAAGIAAAFNAPLAGVVFAIEELSRQFESRYSGVVIAAIVLAGLMGVSAYGDAAYFGSVTAPPLGLHHLLPGLLVAVVCGLAGGLFAKLMILSLTGQSNDRLSALRRRFPVRFAAALGLLIAMMGLATGGMTSGSGTEAARELLHASEPGQHAGLLGLMKFLSTWLTAWTGVPGGIFAPSLSVGAGLGYNVSTLLGGQIDTALIAMGMAGFLAAVTQAPITSAIIVLEMIDGRPMVLSLMAVAMLSAAISRKISRPLYATLAARMLANFSASQAATAAAAAEAATQAGAAGQAANPAAHDDAAQPVASAAVADAAAHPATSPRAGAAPASALAAGAAAPAPGSGVGAGGAAAAPPVPLAPVAPAAAAAAQAATQAAPAAADVAAGPTPAAPAAPPPAAASPAPASPAPALPWPQTHLPPTA